MNSRISRLSHSGKWLEGFSPDLRVPMITSELGHFYVYEPVQIDSEDIVIPIFFFNQEGVQMARCLTDCMIWMEDSGTFEFRISKDPSFYSQELVSIPSARLRLGFSEILICDGVYLKDHCSSEMYCTWSEQMALESKSIDLYSINLISGVDVHGCVAIPIVNPWRSRADGKVIRHVPIMLYSDDTSGNVSKKFNKHMSYYFTLAGLPPRLSNQEYYIHFLSTSNSASALELGVQIVDEIKLVS